MNAIYPPEKCLCGSLDCEMCFGPFDENDPEVIAMREQEAEAWLAEIKRYTSLHTGNRTWKKVLRS